MQNLGQFPVKINHHLAVNNEELAAIINALAFFHEFFTTEHPDIQIWLDVVRDQRIELIGQLATELLRI